ncbi:MAG: hypothetical protein PHT40_00970 [Patescibacteria group bacterium]|nr:hypothetical protein [Patescibacteria group bacterium]
MIKKAKKYSKNPNEFFVSSISNETITQRVTIRRINGKAIYPPRIIYRPVCDVVLINGAIGRLVNWEAKIFKGKEGSRGFPLVRISIDKSIDKKRGGKKQMEEGEIKKLRNLVYNFLVEHRYF